MFYLPWFFMPPSSLVFIYFSYLSFLWNQKVAATSLMWYFYPQWSWFALVYCYGLSVCWYSICQCWNMEVFFDWESDGSWVNSFLIGGSAYSHGTGLVTMRETCYKASLPLLFSLFCSSQLAFPPRSPHRKPALQLLEPWAKINLLPLWVIKSQVFS